MLTDFFKAIKTYYQRGNSSSLGYLMSQEEFVALKENLPPTLQTLSFLRFDDPSGSKLGFQFENDIADLILSVVSTVYPELSAESKESMKNMILAGGVQGTVRINGAELEQLPKKMRDSIMKKVGHSLQKEFNEATQITDYRFYARDAKVDIKGGFLNSQLTSNPTSYLTTILNIINNSSFSLKMYQDKNIELGSTNQLRAIIGAMNSLNISNSTEWGIRTYYASRWNTIRTLPITSHAFHLRYLYELTGAGIEYIETNNGTAAMQPTVDFLIYNQTGGANMQVISVMDILWNVNQQIKFNKPVKTINLSLSGYLT